MEPTDAERQAVETCYVCHVALAKLKKGQNSHAVARKVEELERELGSLYDHLCVTPWGMAHAFAVLHCNEYGKLVFKNLSELNAKLPEFRLVSRFGGILSGDGVDISSDQADELAAAAWLNKDSWAFVVVACGALMQQKRPLSLSLQAVAAHHLRSGPPPNLEKRGQKLLTHTLRNVWIRRLSNELEQAFKLQKSANATSSSTSICRLIAEVLGKYSGASIAEDAVLKVLDSPVDPFAEAEDLRSRALESIGGKIVSDD